MTIKPVARCLKAAVALLTVCELLGSGLLPAAEATSIYNVAFVMKLGPGQSYFSKHPLCVRQTTTIYTTIKREISWVAGNRPHHVEARLIGGISTVDIKDRSIIDEVGYLSTRQVPPGRTNAFILKAKRPGTTDVTFKYLGSVYQLRAGDTQPVPGGEFHLEETLTLSVKTCKKKVVGANVWSGNNALLAGTLNETELTADDQGTFTGQGTMTWVAHQTGVFGCDTSETTDE